MIKDTRPITYTRDEPDDSWIVLVGGRKKGVVRKRGTFWYIDGREGHYPNRRIAAEVLLRLS